MARRPKAMAIGSWWQRVLSAPRLRLSRAGVDVGRVALLDALGAPRVGVGVEDRADAPHHAGALFVRERSDEADRGDAGDDRVAVAVLNVREARLGQRAEVGAVLEGLAAPAGGPAGGVAAQP